MIDTKRKLLSGFSHFKFQFDGLWERTSTAWNLGFDTQHKIFWDTATWGTGKWKNGIAFEIEDKNGRRSTKILLMQDDEFFLVNEKERAPFYVDVIENGEEFGVTILPILEGFANKEKK